MLDHAMGTMPGKGFALHELKNMMIATEGRPRVDLCKLMAVPFIERTSIDFSSQFRRCVCILPPLAWTEQQSIQYTHMSLTQ